MSAVAGEVVIEFVADDRGFKVAVKDAGTVLRQLQGDFNTTTRAIKRMEEAQNSLSTKFRHMVMTLGNLRFVVMDINDIFLRLPMSILRTAGELEKMQQLMTGLSKETDDAKRKLEGMRDMNFVIGMAKNAPFDIQALSDSFVKLKTAGIDPTNGSMKALVDSVARFGGSGEMLKRASVAIQQMTGKGVISMEELRQQLGEAVPTAMKNMAEGMEISMAELAKRISTGTVQAGPALTKMFLQMRLDNDGAAAEMMNTWVGMTAQLKTEWDLTAQYIANNGFGDAAKAVVSDLIALMRNQEFREFAAEFGQALATAVSAIKDTAEFVAKYRSEIAALIAAWAGYKLVTGVIAPVAEAIRNASNNSVAAMRREIAAARENAEIHRRTSLETASSARYSAMAQQEALAKKLETHRAELASVQARNAAILAADAKMRAQMEFNGGVRIPGQRGFQTRAAGNDYIAELGRRNSELLRREQELQREIGKTQQALTASGAVVASTATNFHGLARSLTGTSMAATAAGMAVKGFGAVLNFMGGWVGVAITAIAGLVMWWNKVKNAAQDAADAQKRAALNQATGDDLKSLTEQSIAAAKAVEEARKRMAETKKVVGVQNGRDPIKVDKTQAEKEADAAAYARAVAEDKRLSELRTRAQRTLMERESDEKGRARAEDLQRELRDMENATRQRVLAINKAKAEYIKANGDDSADAVKKIAEFNRERAKVDAEGLKQRQALIEQRSQQAWAMARAAGLSPEQKMAFEAEARQYDEMAKSVGAGIEAITGAITGTVPGGGPKAPKAVPESVAQKLAEKLAEDNARLDAEVAALASKVPGAADAAGKVAELIQRRANGDFRDKSGKDISDAEFNRLAAMTALAAQKEATLKNEEKLLAMADRITSFAEGMRPRYEEAMDMLLDPTRTKSGKGELALDKLIMKMGSDFPAALAKAGMSMTELRDAAKLGDIAPEFEKLLTETERLNDELVKDDQKTAVARMKAENERHRQRLQNMIDEAELAGASPEQLAAMQNALARNMAARENSAAEKAKSPMQKMVDEWRNSTDAMQKATAQWLDSSVEGLIAFARTGKFEFGQFTASILEDLLRIELRKQAVGIFDAVGGVSGIAKAVGSLWPFANGGIMTGAGSMPLKKYAAGGIANSPQLALFGEGTRPEAYVPLPDGRTIPVTMTGAGAAPNVTINVINQSGQAVNANKSQPRFDGKQMILDVVLTAANTPGSFRDGMKGALK